jgi:hypothetical protein
VDKDDDLVRQHPESAPLVEALSKWDRKINDLQERSNSQSGTPSTVAITGGARVGTKPPRLSRRVRNTFPIAPVWVDIPDAKGTQQAVAWEPECYGNAEWAASGDFGLVFFGNQSPGGCGVVECVTYYATCPRDL